MRRLLWLTPLALLLGGCASTALAPNTPASPNGAVNDMPGTGQSAVGQFRLSIDPGALAGTATPVSTRSSQQGQIYSLALENFMGPDTFKIDTIQLVGGELVIGYTVTHPFAEATDLDGGATAQNRMDLGICGRVLFLVDGAESYFSGAATCSTAYVTNPDGYFAPGELISDPGTTANTFPFRVLVDPSGDPFGNYDAPGGGWQNSTFNDGWRGYGMLHQGAAAANEVRIDLAALSGGPFSLDVVIVAKYQDPRGGDTPSEKRANRLPNGDPLHFAYRMPHGALDVEALSFEGETGGLVANDDTTFTTIDFKMRDWDARATEAPGSDLAGETDVSLVAAGESGIPRLEADIPGVTTAVTLFDPLTDILDNDPLGDPGEDSGAADDELYWRKPILNDATAGQAIGFYRGMVRASDVIDVSPPVGVDTWRFNLRPDLTPILGLHTEGATYQHFDVQVEAPVVVGCGPTVPQPDNDFTQPFNAGGRVRNNTFSSPPPSYPSLAFAPLDIATFAAPTYAGGVWQGRSITAQSNSNFFRWSNYATNTAVRITNITGLGQAHDIEVDRTNRILYVQTNATITAPTAALVYGQATANIRWLDYAGSEVTALGGTISTGSSRIVALALDQDDNVYAIDHLNILHKYLKASGYAEDTAAPFPKTLGIGAPMGGMGDPNTRNIHDFVIDWHNGAFFILAQSNESPASTAPGNGYVYRMECDGDFEFITQEESVNPLRLVISDGNNNNGVGDITIDQLNSAGAPLATAGDVQIVVGGSPGFQDPDPDIYIISSELTYNLAATLDFQDIQFDIDQFQPSCVAMDQIGNILYAHPEWDDSQHHFYPPPSGWQ